MLMVYFSVVTPVIAQEQTVGLFVYESTTAVDGYTLFAPMTNTTTYLVDNSGRLIHTWDSNYLPGNGAYLCENGNLLRTGKIGNNPYFPNESGILQEFDWDGNLVWEFAYSTSQHITHHDVEQLPNGNVLILAAESKSYAECIAAGRDSRLIDEYVLWPDYVIEVDPDSLGGTIVWEWHVWDHLIQDFDPTKANYGLVGDHPELVDFNYVRDGYLPGQPHWLHTNSIDYHPEFDQILLSPRHPCEIWIIDHSTTTEEAAGHTGGNSGRGGDLLYRWGNPEVYRAGTAGDQQLFEQHDPQWIEPGYPGEGNILIFNNGHYRPGIDYSQVDEIVPPVDSMGNYYLAAGSAYGPAEPVWTYTSENPYDFYSKYVSGAQRLTNGNTLICDGGHGTFFEVTPDTEIVWLYISPILANGPMMQGDPIPIGTYGYTNHCFRSPRYAPDYPGFQGHLLIPGDPLELYSNKIDDLVIDYEMGAVTLNWSGILNPLVVYNVFGSNDPWNYFTRMGSTSDTTWSTLTSTDRRFYYVTFEVAP